MDLSAAPNRITAAGLRLTRQRAAVLDAIAPGEHLGADALSARARARLGTVSTQSVHDALSALDSAGLVRRIEPAGQAALYETRVADNHHHLVCRSCGTVVDVDRATGPAPCLEVLLPPGFVIDRAEVTWWGHCPRCSAGRAPGEAAATAG